MTITYFNKRMDPAVMHTLLIPSFEPLKVEDLYFSIAKKILMDGSQKASMPLSNSLFELTDRYFRKFDRMNEVRNCYKELFDILSKDPTLSPKKLREDLTKKIHKIKKGTFNQAKKLFLRKFETALNLNIKNKQQTGGGCSNEEVIQLRKKFGRAAYRFNYFVDNLPKTLERSSYKIMDLLLRVLQKHPSVNNSNQEERELLLYAIKHP